jgi:sulfur-oxidizing protein SoxZ
MIDGSGTPMARFEVRIAAPSTARRGEVIEIKTMIFHAMEHGFRLDSEGDPIPRKIINAFLCRYNGDIVFSADLHPAMAENPYLVFYTAAVESGTLEFIWQEDGGDVFVANQSIAVT